MYTARRVQLRCPTPVTYASLSAWLDNAQEQPDGTVRLGSGVTARLLNGGIATYYGTYLLATISPRSITTFAEYPRSLATLNRIASLLPPGWYIGGEGDRHTIYAASGERVGEILRGCQCSLADPAVTRLATNIGHAVGTWVQAERERTNSPDLLAHALVWVDRVRLARRENFRLLLRERGQSDSVHTVMVALERWYARPLPDGVAERVARVLGLPDGIARCEYCQSWVGGDKWTGEYRACDDCLGEWNSCYLCGLLAPDMDWIDDEPICDTCRSEFTTWCDGCGRAHLDENLPCEAYTELCSCTPIRGVFEFPNNGHGTVTSESAFRLETAAGEISAEGRVEVVGLLRHTTTYEAAEAIVESVGTQWQTKYGNYPKRLSRALYKAHGIKLSPETMSRIGSIARDNTENIETYNLWLTRDVNRHPRNFGYESSCWWQSYTTGRCAFKGAGGIALLHEGDGENEPEGRAWIMPLNEQLMPTHNPVNAHAYIVFNGYGSFEGYTAARIVAQLARMTYRKIPFTSSPMWINNDTGYLVAPEDVANNVNSLALSLPTHGYTEQLTEETA